MTKRKNMADMNNDIRNLTKWLNEEQEAPIDRQALARVLAVAEQTAQQEQEPVVCDGDFPEGFDASLGIPAQALRAANAIMFDVIGERKWDVPCTAQHVLTYAKKYTSPPAQRTWVGLTDEDWGEIGDMPDTFDQGVAWAQARLKEKNT